jgi:hypothetical protein
MTGSEVNDFAELLACIFKKHPQTVAMVIGPYLVSEKVQGYRGELRTSGRNCFVMTNVKKMNFQEILRRGHHMGNPKYEHLDRDSGEANMRN